jgi:hypothetical protein
LSAHLERELRPDRLRRKSFEGGGKEDEVANESTESPFVASERLYELDRGFPLFFAAKKGVREEAATGGREEFFAGESERDEIPATW